MRGDAIWGYHIVSHIKEGEYNMAIYVSNTNERGYHMGISHCLTYQGGGISRVSNINEGGYYIGISHCLTYKGGGISYGNICLKYK